MTRHAGNADADGAGAGRGVTVAVGAARELAVVEVEGDHPLEDALGGEGVGQALARILSREVEARRVEMTRVDEQAEALGRRPTSRTRRASSGMVWPSSLPSQEFSSSRRGPAGMRSISSPSLRVAIASASSRLAWPFE